MKLFEQFVQERKYLTNVSPRTIEFYWDCFKFVHRFADFSEEGLKQWVIASRQHGISAAAVNSRITGINAYLRWAGEPHKLSLLKEAERILPSSTPSKPKLTIHSAISSSVKWTWWPRDENARGLSFGVTDLQSRPPRTSYGAAVDDSKRTLITGAEGGISIY